jgi:hypothetical protein
VEERIYIYMYDGTGEDEEWENTRAWIGIGYIHRNPCIQMIS